jgi:tetratricopeptide (TPR) repeat protein
MVRIFAAMAVVSLGLAQIAGAAPVGDDILKPASLRLAEAGRVALAQGDANTAIDNFEAALASDPKNVSAFTGIAASYEKLGLPGKAVKYYREALVLNPSDLTALEGQGRAYVSRGATARAQVNLARIKALCKADCSAAIRLQTAIDAPRPVVADAATKTPPAVKN